VGDWIRPVSAREHEEVSEYERQYPDGSDPRVLDVVDVPLLAPRPRDYQQENWLLDPAEYWTRSGEVSSSELRKLTDPDAPLWVDGHSTYNGINDRIPFETARDLRTSLRLIEVDDLTLRIFAPGEAFGNSKRRVQASFRHAGTTYGLWVTDPLIERHYLALPDGKHRMGQSHLTVSLGEPHDGYCYKLVAAVIGNKE
jgi:hypothetical protein